MIQLKFKAPLKPEELDLIRRAFADKDVVSDGEIVRIGGVNMLARVFNVLNAAKIDAKLVSLIVR